MKFKATLAAMTLLMGVSSAQAADLDRGSNTVDVDSERPFSWTGFYVGGRLGYGNANHELGTENFFKDYCVDKGDTTVGFDEHGNVDGDEVWKTVANKKEAYEGITGDSCETLEKLAPAKRPFAAGSHTTVKGDTFETASVDGINSSGITGGFQVGFDKQIGQRVIVGVFGSYDLSSMETNAATGGIEIPLIEKGDEWSIGARLGYLLHPRVMAYVLAAYAQADWEFVTGDIGDGGGRHEVTFDGVTVGGGLEYAMTRNIFIGIEGTHTFYGKETLDEEYIAEVNLGSRTTDEIGETKVLGTVKIKMNPVDGLID